MFPFETLKSLKLISEKVYCYLNCVYPPVCRYVQVDAGSCTSQSRWILGAEVTGGCEPLGGGPGN